MQSTRQEIAEVLLGCALDSLGFAPCPGANLHKGKTGPRDFRVALDGAPTAFCFHTSCSAEVDAFNYKLRLAIWKAEHGDRDPQGIAAWGVKVAPEPRQDEVKRPPLDLEKLKAIASAVPGDVDEGWLRKRSPVDVENVTSGKFLDALFAPGEKVLVFTKQFSQGDFLWWVGKGSYRLSPDRTVRAVASNLPVRGPDGVWYLVQPVTGKWEINGKMTIEGQPPKWTRRSEQNVTSWRHYVIESDDAPADLWLRVLAQLPLPIAAIYTSGKRSIHALVKYEVPSKATWDATRDVIRQLLCPLGADAGALTAVRLSRLPGCFRGDSLQRLLYLNPEPENEPLMLRPEISLPL
jgi:hypothetical protein